MNTEAPTWIVGLELSTRSSGALQFTRWVREALHAPVCAVYISEMYMLGMPPADGAGYVVAMRAEAQRWLATLSEGQGAPFDAVQILDEIDAETGLSKVAHGAPGLIIGRRVAGEHRVVRLGRVARRLLRSLPAPVIVVPPEVGAQSFSGPVLLATDLDARSIPAARFAASFAAAADRPLVCVHVDHPRWNVPTPEWESRLAELGRIHRQTAERDTRAWAAQHCPGAEVVLEQGEPTERLVGLAGSRAASLVVLGSRRLGVIERAFIGSTASTVAAAAACAVAVVPPDANVP